MSDYGDSPILWFIGVVVIIILILSVWAISHENARSNCVVHFSTMTVVEANKLCDQIVSGK